MTDTPDLAIDPAAGHDADAAGCETYSHHGYISNKDDYLKRLRRIEGQARGLQRMVEEEQYCIDILTQVSAINSALRNVALGLLDDHMRHCVADAVNESDEAAEIKFKEVADAIARFSR